MDILTTPKPITPDNTEPVLGKLRSDFRIVLHDLVRALFGLPYVAEEKRTD